MGTKSCKAIISILLLLVTAQFTIGLSDAAARQSKDIILVLDTSLSMVGQAGAQNILDKVKRSIGDYIGQVEEGDRVTFMTFDVDTRIYPTVLINDENDRDILKKYITMTEATGLWTYTYKMIVKVIETADSLEKEKDGRQTEIVIMTDAIDDPPPGDMKKFDIHALMDKAGKKKDWWIYVLSFTNLKNSDAVKQRLGADLGMISDKVKIIEAGEPEKGKRALIESEQQREAESRNIIIPIIIVGAAILLILAILFFVKRLSELKAAGRLEYWNNEVIEPYTQNFDLARRPSREVVIGKGLGCVLNIRDIVIKKPFSIKAIRHEGAVRMQIIGNESAVVEMVNRQADGLLLDGDIFKVGNYTFKYFQA
ncbi:MAG TPA: VWA domain-containing protein [Spirochaetota bacterium]|nr:VWA domain-containing protein [Spirochaetota bacterium]HOD15461.1 VWA domain-containing protein [Spirochaetota bacterium]HPN13706.1 VWA domain-containing protein [Spirochaetota bacterium]